MKKKDKKNISIGERIIGVLIIFKRMKKSDFGKGVIELSKI